jgi:pilus assembly protein Flp/PilA
MLNQINLWQAMIVGWVRGHLVKDDTGASLVEYALLLALIAVVAIGALVFLGNTVNTTLNHVANAINNAP